MPPSSRCGSLVVAPPVAPVLIIVLEFDAHVAIGTLAKQFGQPSADQCILVAIVDLIVNGAHRRQPKAHSWAIGCLQDLPVQIRGRILQQPHHRHRAAEELGAICSANGIASFIGEDQQRDDLRQHERQHQKGDHLPRKPFGPKPTQPAHQIAFTSPAKL